MKSGQINRLIHNWAGSEDTAGTRNQFFRDEWLKLTLRAIPAGSRILDAGAGELKYKSFCDHLQYVAQDFGQYDGTGDGLGLQSGSWDQSKLDIVCDISDIPEPDESFDAIMCIEVLEHLPGPVEALREFSRLLKKGGILILTAPFCSLTHFAPYYFHTGFSRYFYKKWLPELGYEITEMEANGNYFEYLAQEIRRISQIKKIYSESTKISRFRNILNNISRSILLSWLSTLSQNDKGSNELLCFGHHVRATKL